MQLQIVVFMTALPARSANVTMHLSLTLQAAVNLIYLKIWGVRLSDQTLTL